jgi:hypothetical protein
VTLLGREEFGTTWLRGCVAHRGGEEVIKKGKALNCTEYLNAVVQNVTTRCIE